MFVGPPKGLSESVFHLLADRTVGVKPLSHCPQNSGDIDACLLRECWMKLVFFVEHSFYLLLPHFFSNEAFECLVCLRSVSRLQLSSTATLNSNTLTRNRQSLKEIVRCCTSVTSRHVVEVEFDNFPSRQEEFENFRVSFLSRIQGCLRL